MELWIFAIAFWPFDQHFCIGKSPGSVLLTIPQTRLPYLFLLSSYECLQFHFGHLDNSSVLRDCPQASYLEFLNWGSLISFSYRAMDFFNCILAVQPTLFVLDISWRRSTYNSAIVTKLSFSVLELWIFAIAFWPFGLHFCVGKSPGSTLLTIPRSRVAYFFLLLSYEILKLKFAHLANTFVLRKSPQPSCLQFRNRDSLICILFAILKRFHFFAALFIASGNIKVGFFLLYSFRKFQNWFLCTLSRLVFFGESIFV